jgi:hypothetical protein
MTRQERVDHSRRICRKITQKINGFSPRGLGHWRRTWDLVEAPSDQFLDALNRWIDEDTHETREDVEAAAEGLLVAWEEAGDLFRLLEGSSSRGVANVV